MMKPLFAAGALLLSLLCGFQLQVSAEESARLIINEVMYDPPGNEVDGEWIEILVVEGTTLENWTLSDLDGHLFTFPPLFFPAPTYVLVRVGEGIPDLDPSDGRMTLYMNFTQPILNNNGDELLLDSGGSVFDFFAYGPDSLVDYPPLGVHWEGMELASRKNQSLALFPSGKSDDGPDDWHSMTPTPGASNGGFQLGEEGVLLSEVYYNNHRDNEFFCLFNSGEQSVNLTGWIVTDLEGEIYFPLGSVIGSRQRICATQNSTSYFEDLLEEADFTYGSGGAKRMSHLSGQLVLRNGGDELVLLTQYGRQLDAVIWGDSLATSEGWKGEPSSVVDKGAITKRIQADGDFVDTNTSSDWTSLREFRLGQSDFMRKSFHVNGSLISYYSPGSSLNTVKRQFRNATDSILLNAYQLTSRALGDELARAASKGVQIKILLEGQPVGGVDIEELRILGNLSSLGVRVRFLMEAAEEGIFKRYTFNHAKYAIIDNSSLLVSSENWGRNGYPENGSGNRGWGVIVEDASLSSYFVSVFYEDWNPLRRDSISFDDVVERIETHEDYEAVTAYEPPLLGTVEVNGSGEVVAVVGPDNAMDPDTILQLIGSAKERVYIEQFYIRETWQVNGVTIRNPFLDKLIQAAEGGCEVKVLLDGSWYNALPEDSSDNDDVVQYLNAIGESEGIDLSAKLMDLDAHGVLKLHNKGMVVDGNRVLISSLNWNYNSFARNREVGLIIHSETIGAYFERIFLHDWKDDVAAPKARIKGASTAVVGETITLSAMGSFDNQGIASFSWDVDSDGIEDSNHSVIRISFDNPGSFTITLEVEDEWGNSDRTSMTVDVRAREAQLGANHFAVILVSATALIISFYHIKKKRTKDI
ncbi:MAG: phospholipase D-like domain-containing protein [Thermoplasmata archaeon]